MGVAFLGPGPDTLRSVLGLPDNPAHRLAHPHRLSPVHAAPTPDHLVGGPHRQRRTLTEPLGKTVRRPQQFVMAMQLPNKSDLLGAVRINRISRQQQFQSIRNRHMVRQSQRPHNRRLPQLHLRVGETRSFAGEHEIACQDRGEPITDTRPVDRGDRRFPDFHAALESGDRGPLPERARPAAGRAGAVTQIRSCTEGPACTRDDGDPGFFVLTELSPGSVESLAHGPVDSIEGFRPVVGDGGDVAVSSVGRCFVSIRHGRQLSPCSSR